MGQKRGHASRTWGELGSRPAGVVVVAQYQQGNARPVAQSSARGRVKWFNATKGYGFVTLDEGGDAFCHASALQAVGHAELPQGATITCDLADSERGLQVVAVHDVDVSTAEAPRPARREFNGGGGHDRSAPSGPMSDGRIKFFNDQKGFGFVTPESGAGDIYLHASALRRSGVQMVEPEQRIRFNTRQGNKGVEVDRIELL